MAKRNQLLDPFGRHILRTPRAMRLVPLQGFTVRDKQSTRLSLVLHELDQSVAGLEEVTANRTQRTRFQCNPGVRFYRWNRSAICDRSRIGGNRKAWSCTGEFLTGRERSRATDKQSLLGVMFLISFIGAGRGEVSDRFRVDALFAGDDTAEAVGHSCRNQGKAVNLQSAWPLRPSEHSDNLPLDYQGGPVAFCPTCGTQIADGASCPGNVLALPGKVLARRQPHPPADSRITQPELWLT